MACIAVLAQVALIICLFFAPATCLADLYKYTDKSGSIVITDKFESIPAKYHKNLQVIKTAPPASVSAPAASVADTPQPAGSDAGKPMGNETWHGKYHVPAAVLVAVILSFFIIRKVCENLGGRRIGVVFFVVISLAAGIYLYQTYMEQMSATYLGLRKDAQNIKNNVESRDNKTDRSLNGIEQAR